MATTTIKSIILHTVSLTSIKLFQISKSIWIAKLPIFPDFHHQYHLMPYICWVKRKLSHERIFCFLKR